MIILYSQDGCPRCGILKTKLENKNVRYEINNDADYMIKKGITKIPMLEVNGEIMKYYDAVLWINAK